MPINPAALPAREAAAAAHVQATEGAARRLLREAAEVAAATWRQPAQAVRGGAARSRCRALRRAFDDALLALGRRMYAEGIDDDRTGALIRDLEGRLRLTGGRPANLEAEREGLFRQLAGAALEEDAPLPGADEEYAAARVAERELAEQEAVLEVLRNRGTGWARAIIGYVAAGGLGLLALAALAG